MIFRSPYRDILKNYSDLTAIVYFIIVSVVLSFILPCGSIHYEMLKTLPGIPKKKLLEINKKSLNRINY
jgi:hypothetical protein